MVSTNFVLRLCHINPDEAKENIIANAVHDVYFVPENIKADALMRNMRKTHNSMAVVLDEYGGMQGIVTMHDLIEEFVGEINEEAPDPKAPEEHIEKISDNVWQIHGNVPLDELGETIGIELNIEGCDTFTGMVFGALETIPADGEESFSLEIENMTIEIKKIEAHQIENAVITIHPAEPKTEEMSE